ncbi:hypothetical protein ACFSSA_07520 [Luteolibacter algae]|uniref:Uncharacterized protein n=1 Tax=Luteolibacter algae TaxID=454151 RepID=A0ABW5D6Y1_9BACT
MKTKNSIALAAIAIAFLPVVNAEESSPAGHDHAQHADHENTAGPNGGRIIHSVEPHAEFLVTAERKIQITFLGEDGKAIPAGAQSITAIGGDRSSPTRMTFEKSDDFFISDKALPEGNDIPIVLMIKLSPEAKTVTEKFNINLAQCPTCQHQEYACTCPHGEDDHEGHDHN